MVNLLRKELKLSTVPITYIFLCFACMVFLPSYPILMSSFFVCLGIFQSFHQTRVTNDILYTVLLPIKRDDAVRSKFIMVCFFELAGFILIAIFSFIRMSRASNSIAYEYNVLMNPNLVFLGFCLLVFLIFNLIFVTGFFKTVYGINKPYIIFLIVALLVIGIGEVLHFIPSLEFLNDALGANPASTTAQIIIFVICLVLFVAGTWLAYSISKKRFRKINL